MTQQINLSIVCDQYRALLYYEGIVELSLCSGTQTDPQNLALLYYKSGQPIEDSAGQQALSRR